MGLRETKAARSRARMVDAAIELFERDGYDATTMEQIAERAEVGTTTLYRYFPSKDLLLLDRLTTAIEIAPHLRDRPADEPLEHSLAHVLLEIADTVDDPEGRIPELRRIIDASAAPRAKLWDYYRTAREELEGVLADRLGEDAASLTVRVTAGMTLELLQLIDEISRAGDYSRSHGEITRDVLGDLSDARIVLPSVPV
ncbi:helix-turn-helix domain-containing protein [Microbacterium lacus]|uniref:TetR family transcriptional regulator n=1 Tax=Microbacterium lacus TaxID=415217 RepID=A0ABP4S2J1_9MICO